MKQTLGVETVAYTYFVYHVVNIFPKIVCPATMRARVAEVKYNVENNHEVPLTDEMKRVCDEFCDGTRKSNTVESTSAFASYQVPAPSVAPAATPPVPAAPAEGGGGGRAPAED